MGEAVTLAALWKRALEGARRCRVEIESEQIGDEDALRERLAALCVEPGWMCTTDAVTAWTGGMPERFLPLSAEWVEDEHTSGQLRRFDRGWLLTRVRECALEGDASAQSAPDLAFDERYRSNAPGREAHAMVYRVYYRQDEDGVYRPFVARWLGWEANA